MSILFVNNLSLDLVAKDFSDGHAPNNGGPTKTSRALAIIHLAARDAYAKVTSAFTPRLGGLPAPPAGLPTNDATGAAAVLGAGIRAATLLYPDFSAFINEQSLALTDGANATALFYGAEVAERWVASRQNDGSSLPQTDSMFSQEPGHHRPDPVSKQPNLGRTWGQVAPFVLSSVVTDAPLAAPPKLTDSDYAAAFDDVFVNGRDNTPQLGPTFQQQAATGLFWAYDGANKLGTPPRLYNQIVTATSVFQGLSHKNQVNALAAINAAMAD